MPFGPGFGLGAGTDDLAADLGMTPEELTAAFESGQTLPEIAEANGVNLDELFGDRFGGGRSAPWGDGAPPWADQSEENHPDGGARFTVQWPADQNQPPPA